MSNQVRWRIARPPRRWAGTVLLAGIFLSVVLVVVYRTYLGRATTYLMMDDILDVEWYDPAEIVRGESRAPLVRVAREDSGIAPWALDRIMAYAEEHESCAMLVMHKGLVVEEAYWCQLEPSDRPQAMSMAKTVTALMVGIAIDEGRLRSIHDPVSTYLEEWRNDERSRITIADLLSMRSGLRNENNPWNPFSDITLINIGTDVPEHTFDVQAEVPPGERFDYNNVNYQVLGLLVERVFGKRYAPLLSEKLWQPLGADDALVWLDVPGGTAKTYCCLFAQARDWARLGWLLAKNGRLGAEHLVSEAWVDSMRTPSKLEPAYGLGLWLDHPKLQGEGSAKPVPMLAKDLLLLVGQGQQRVYIIPSAELVVVRLGHEPMDWDDAFIPNTLIKGIEAGTLP